MNVRTNAAFAALIVVCALSSTTHARKLPGFDAGAGTAAQLGAPSFLSARELSPLPRSALADPEDAARAHLRHVARRYRLRAADVDAMTVVDTQMLAGGGALTRFAHRIDGIEVFRERLNVLHGRDGALVAVSGFAAGAPLAARRAFDSTDPGPALRAVLAEHGFAADVAARSTATPSEGGYTWLAVAGSDADAAELVAPARVKRVWFRVGESLLPAWYVEVQVRDAGAFRIDAYVYAVSAVDSAILFRYDLTAHAAFTYRVYAESTPPFLPLPGPGGREGFPHPTGTPNGFLPSFVTPNLVTLQNAPFSRNDPWLPDGATKTIGNNVEAFANVLEPDNFGPAASDECNVALPVDGDLHACVTSGTTFDHVYNHGAAPNASRVQVAAGVTNLFYTINYLHDFFYDAGFNEAAGNAQTSNFGRGGLSGDSIFAESQDYSGTNNATMLTPPDGQRPRMRMYTWQIGLTLFKVNAPAAIAGVKPSGSASFGAQTYDLNANVAVARDAANPDGPQDSDGCSPIVNAGAIAGKIALVDRGTCTFVTKVRNVQAAGASAALIVNNQATGAIGLGGDDPLVTIPAASVSLEDGAAIKAQLAQSTPVLLRMASKVGLPRDASFDNTVIAHEWGHYLTNRLIGDAVGLLANQARGLGEGWSDFLSLLLLVKDSDRNLPANAGFTGAYPETPYPMGGPDYAPDVFNDAYYYGIRRYPYSRDVAKNPLGFRHIADGVPLPASPPRSTRVGGTVNSAVHSAGEVWASVLWECYTNLLNDTGRLSFAQAQDRMKRYLVGGLKMTPIDPTFVEARDAMLAVILAQDPADHALCLAGFAKRGLGVGAVAPDRYSSNNAGVIESYRTSAADPAKVTVVEYYNASLDHYFLTWVTDEIQKLDGGIVLRGWVRTGQSLFAYPSSRAGTSPVCRFYIPPALGDSHFYGRGTTECNDTDARNPSFDYEDPAFMHMFLPAAGVCPAGTVEVYRVFSNRKDANHRYTTDRSIRDAMVANGWLAEGDGPNRVVMCAPG
jgi:hypothetical protein